MPQFGRNVSQYTLTHTIVQQTWKLKNIKPTKCEHIKETDQRHEKTA